MKRFIRILLLFGFVQGVASCDKLPENGDLDGNWQLLTIEHHATGQVEQVKDQQVFWAVQLKMIYYRGGGLDKEYLSRFVHQSDSLFLYDFYYHTRYEDYLLTDSATTELSPAGIVGISGRYAVETLNHKSMVLNSTDTRLVFRKF